MKKKLTMGVMGLFLMSSLAACAPNVNAPSTDATKEKVEQPAATTKEEEAPKEEEVKEVEEVVDMGGRVIRFGYNWDATPQPGDFYGDRDIARKEYLEKKYNCKIEFVNLASYGMGKPDVVMTQTTLAGDPAADIALINEGINYNLISKGIIQPLSDIKSIDIDNPQWEPYSKQAGTFGGKIYSANSGRLDIRGGFFYNKRAFEEAGLPDLYELQRNGEWTWEKLEEFAKALTIDKDGDGVIDQYGLAHFDEFSLQLIYSNGGDVISYTGDDAQLKLDSENVMEALQFYNKLENELKVVYKQREGEGWDYHMTAFRDGKAAMLCYQKWAVGSFMQMEDDYGYVMMPKGPRAKDYTSLLTGINSHVMSSAVKNPEEVGIIYREWFAPYPEDTEESWKDGQYNIFRDPYAVDETMEMQYTKSVLPGYCSFPVGPELVELDRAISTGEYTPAAAIEMITPKLQAKLDEALGK